MAGREISGAGFRGVYPRGLIEGVGFYVGRERAYLVSAGYTPAASLKGALGHHGVGDRVDVSAGYTPAASLKGGDHRTRPADQDRFPRGIPSRPH